MGRVRSRFPAVICQNVKVSLGGKGEVEGRSQEDSLPTCLVRKLKEPVGQTDSLAVTLAEVSGSLGNGASRCVGGPVPSPRLRAPG